jgi:hypothetical protein
VTESKSYTNRVWKGDSTTVNEARDAYQKDAKSGLIPYAVALYSFRANFRFASELLGLRFELLERAATVTVPDALSADQLQFADQADVLSTYFEWMSRRPELREEAAGLRMQARALIIRALSMTHDPTHHTFYLLALTAVRILLTEGRFLNARQELIWMASHAHQIKDANQRARVYRKMGMLSRACGLGSSGWIWGMRACFVPGAPLNVRAKSVAALFGIDR